MTLEEYKREANKRKTKNFYFVNVAVAHNCAHCNNKIAVGQNCLTANMARKGRKWYCDECVALLIRLHNANMVHNAVPFGDEGGHLAALQLIDELESELYARRYSY